MVAQTRLLGTPIPQPEFLPANDFTPAAQYLAGLKAKGTAPYLRASFSPATRVAAAARDKGLDIAGTVMAVSGEPISDAKRAVMESVGAEVLSQDHSAEFGTIGYGCSNMRSGNRLHLFEDALLMVAHRRRAPPSIRPMVPASLPAARAF
ncbi:MAG: hypothetical protein FJW31_03645 [Acidobacteria bacterium]|nr:hypothetical protein [Acidobacteriota bacterium]